MQIDVQVVCETKHSRPKCHLDCDFWTEGVDLPKPPQSQIEHSYSQQHDAGRHYTFHTANEIRSHDSPSASGWRLPEVDQNDVRKTPNLAGFQRTGCNDNSISDAASLRRFVEVSLVRVCSSVTRRRRTMFEQVDLAAVCSRNRKQEITPLLVSVDAFAPRRAGVCGVRSDADG